MLVEVHPPGRGVALGVLGARVLLLRHADVALGEVGGADGAGAGIETFVELVLQPLEG